MKRKFVVAIMIFVLSSVVISFLCPLETFLGEKSSFLSNLLMVSIYTGAGVFLYGFPVSIAIEWMTKSWGDARFFFAFSFHLIFGVLPVFILWSFTLFSIIISVCYFLLDEFFKHKTGLAKLT